MTKHKKSAIITIIIIAIIFICCGIYFFLHYTADENSLTVVEKKWLTDNINKVIDVNVYNDIPVYGYNGEGIIFDFLDYFSKENDINFNKITESDLKAFLETFSVDDIKLLFIIKEADLLAQNPKFHYHLEEYGEIEKKLIKMK